MSEESNNVADMEATDSVSEALGAEHAVTDSAEKMGPVEEKGGPIESPLEVGPSGMASLAVGGGLPENRFQDEQHLDEHSGDREVEGQEAVTDPSVGEEATAIEEGATGAQGGTGSKEDSATKKGWYILKVQSNRERSIAEALRRKIAIEGLEEYFGDVIVPTEKVTEFKGGKKKVVERKLYPGYIVVSMCINDDTWFAVRETSGIGDFTGSGGKPTPMLAHEVARIVHQEEEERDEAPKLDIRFKIKDRVKIKEGTFEGFEGDVNNIDEASGRVTVMINIFSRSTPVELEYWQIESV